VKSSFLTYAEYTGTREGDRLSTLAAGYHMTFREKVQFSEEAEKLSAEFQKSQRGQLLRAIKSWQDSPPS